LNESPITVTIPVGATGTIARQPSTQYTVKYYNGSTLLKSVSAAYGSASNDSYAPAKTGYNFSGWYTAASGGTKVTTITKAQSLYAHYAKKSYTVKYYDGSTLIGTASVKYKAAPMAGPAKTGHSFSGWYSAKTGGVKVTSITKSQSLYARYAKKTYTTTYYNGTKLYKTVKSKYQSALVAGPKKSGYRFLGWYTAKTGGTKVTSVEKSRTLYARYVQRFTITYYNGSVQLKKVTVDKGSVLKDSYAPDKPGYEFIGWYSTKTGGKKITTATATMKVYARYVAVGP
jgi:uncharacterized repeat protein (TIGR02543 family)